MKANDIIFVDINSGLMIIAKREKKNSQKFVFQLVDSKYKNVLLTHSNPIAVYQYTIEKLEELEKCIDKEVRQW